MNQNEKKTVHITPKQTEAVCPLNRLAPGECCTVRELGTAGAMRRRFLDIGLIENTPVTCVGRSPAGDPCAYLIRGAVIAIRKNDCRDIFVERNGVSSWD